MYLRNALILSGNNNWPPVIDLIGGFSIFVKRLIMEHLIQLEKLYSVWKNTSSIRIQPLSNSSASSRLYFRLFDKEETYIGVYNGDIKENRAFFHFSKVFQQAESHVPEIYLVSDSELYYLIEDLGDLNLLDILKKEGETENVKQLYKKAIDQLFGMQLYGNKHINFELFSYPRAEFDSQSVLWDLNYFKYYFLKVSGLPFDEQLLENDFQYLAKTLGKQKCIGFMYRDFQARNIQVLNNDVWLIDYQGGRKGPMLYDLVSILYQASAQLSDSFREELKTYYKVKLDKKFTIGSETFEQDFISMVFIRIIQTLGAYGFRGIIEKKAYFIESIPLALVNLDKVIKNQYLSLDIPYFIQILSKLFQLKSKFVIK